MERLDKPCEHRAEHKLESLTALTVVRTPLDQGVWFSNHGKHWAFMY